MPAPRSIAAKLRRWRPIAGLASAVVPAAVVVHLVAEGLSLGRGWLTLDFVLRHVYLVVLAVLSVWVFARTVGLGAGRFEVRRRTGLLRAALAGPRRSGALVFLLLANLAFFTLTQTGEGLPVLSGALWVGLGAGALGSILSALLVYAFGRTVLTAAVAALDWHPRRTRGAAPQAPPVSVAQPRTASTTFSLFVPNRPPPVDPFIELITTLIKGIHPCSAWLARRIGRRRSFSGLRTS